MFPHTGNLDVEALSGICGSISIACWVVVFSPQIIENFRRGSAEGLSLLFLIIWLLGDVFNILGAVLQGVIPTMTILAVYYTLADIILLVQCFYYRGFSFKDEVPAVETGTTTTTTTTTTTADTTPVPGKPSPTERTALLPASGHNGQYSQMERDVANTSASSSTAPSRAQQHSDHRKVSTAMFLHSSVDGTHLSPATPFIDPSPNKPAQPARRVSTLQSFLFNTIAVMLVCTAGFLGWYVSTRTNHHQIHNPPDDDDGKYNAIPTFDPLGQVFGYLCAVLYLGSRFPQILLNFRRKSTEGVSLLFFLFACIGNLTYVLSILAYSPVCGDGKKTHCRPNEAKDLYGRYILVNLSWLVGSFGTLLLDLLIFAQFFLYSENGIGGGDEESGLEGSSPSR